MKDYKNYYESYCHDDGNSPLSPEELKNQNNSVDIYYLLKNHKFDSDHERLNQIIQFFAQFKYKDTHYLYIFTYDENKIKYIYIEVRRITPIDWNTTNFYNSIYEVSEIDNLFEYMTKSNDFKLIN